MTLEMQIKLPCGSPLLPDSGTSAGGEMNYQLNADR